MIFRPLIIPIVLTIYSLVVIYMSLQLQLSPPMIVGDSMQPRSFPIFLMVINLVLVVLLARQLLRSPPPPVPLEGMTTWASMGLMLVFYGITVTSDFFIAIAVVMFLLCLSWGERRLHVAAGVSLATPLSLFFLFDEVLQIRFPRGLITNWYYG